MSFLFGSAEIMRNLERRIDALVRSGMPVLIEGETGTGKEALARHLHAASGGGRPWLRFVCGAGSSSQEFTQALRSTDGTVFLKHVDLLPLELQGRLLSELDRETGCWFLSAGSNPLLEQVDRNHFLPALYHRLSAHRVYLPSLRERRKDIRDLLAVFFRRWGAVAQERFPLPDSVLQALDRHHWPGNVRELENLARAYLITNDPQAIMPEVWPAGRQHFVVQDGGEKPVPLKRQVKQASRKIESQIILQVLERNRWNRRRSAENLQISYRSLLYKMKECKIRQGSGGRELVE
jgi:two-component system response regulator AtoC